MSSITDIIKAREFAEKKHGCQKYGEAPYVKHLDDVANVLIEVGLSTPEKLHLITAAYLHDILEDTATSYNDIKTEFGIQIAEIVYAVTDELGRNRKERADKTYPKIENNADALIIKLADKIANIRTSIREESTLRDMYKKEYPKFRQYFYRPYNTIESSSDLLLLWEKLDFLMESIFITPK